MTEARIAAVGDYVSEEGGDLTDLKPIVKATLGQPVRRIGRFISLALIGAGRCLAGQTPPPDTAVYFTTGSGDFEVTVEVMEHLFRDGFPPKPLSFINTVSNAACFYVAKSFGLSGRSTCLGARAFGFETALQLALLDLKMGTVTSALIGSADIVLQPLAIHRQRLNQAPDAPIGEGAHWLWLTADGEGARAADCRFFASREELMAWIAAFDPATTVLGLGEGLDGDRFGLTRTFDYRAGRPYYDSRTAAAPSAFLAHAKAGETMLHASTDGAGRYAAFTVAA
ncbi:MAG: hypothetical protein EON95_05725 [Caulobacteraceae bacterium]|nr:MAG: hypothetical protein EON95_05725 [Caulobacteraceae bacterium]